MKNRGKCIVKKERLFYLDFVRAVAAISIIMTHFNARYLYLSPPAPEKAIITTTVSNIYIGSWGVSLFFIISGAALMYVYEERCDWKRFYQKRFFSIYPMFWLAYSFAFLYLFYVNKAVPAAGETPKMNIIFSILGFDGLLVENFPMFYILGEWFLGVIILMYLLFPLLRKLILQYPAAAGIGIMLIYVWMVFFYDYNFSTGKIIFTRLPEICFGMYFVRLRKRVDAKLAAGAFVILILNAVFKPSWYPNLQTTYVGIASFLVLVYLSYHFNNLIINKICSIISKYSYAIFLVHHVIIARMMASFDLANIPVLYSYILFIAVCVVIAVFSWLLYNFHARVMASVFQVYEEIRAGKADKTV